MEQPPASSKKRSGARAGAQSVELESGDVLKPQAVSDANSPDAQESVDRLLDYMVEQIELLAFDEPETGELEPLLSQLIESLADPRKAVRIRLVDVLGQIGEPAMPFLLGALSEHNEPIVRRACCNAMANIGDDTAVSGLVAALLKDADISVKSAAAGALAKIGAPAYDAVREILTSTTASESCKGHAAWAMASMSDEVSGRLYASVNDPSAVVRTAVVGAIAQLAQKQSTPSPSTVDMSSGMKASDTKASDTEAVTKPVLFLLQALSDRASDVRIEAAAHLARLNCQQAHQPLMICLKDDDWEVRKAAVLALGKLNNVRSVNSQSVAAIAQLKTDPVVAVQQVATLVSQQIDSVGK